MDKSEINEFFEKHSPHIIMILPTYNEEKTLQGVLEKLIKLGVRVVVVDDGSKDRTNKIATRMARTHPENINLYRHQLNQGLGASIRTGIEASLPLDPEVMITFDADGQHHTRDIIKVARPIIDGRADIVVGKRNFKEMPFRKKFGNNVMNIITGIFYGKWVKDSQSGLRAFNQRAGRLLEIHNRDYGVSSEIVGEVKRKDLKLIEVPITTIYTDYSLSKGTNTIVGLKILAKLIRNVLK
jgi:glycosyltransferase involved in cell wall biosynthesis